MPLRTKTQRLGQHFLVDVKVLARLVDASAVGKHEMVCEAGTGYGILTEELCMHAKHVVSYEVDRALFARARATLAFQNLTLVNADLFKRPEEKFFDVFVSNLPYSKSRDAFEWLATKTFDRAIVMVQKEFANKLTAKPADRNYRAISAIASYCFQIERLFDVEKKSFQPPPLVESVVIRATLKHSITHDAIRSVNMLFSQRNKLASTVAAKLGSAKMDFGDRRVDQLVPAQIMALARLIK